ncbi:hypothetical protein [Streptomyces sp. CC208A]|uniref:hypothetical protein n=1 Tax=Streptomyces sp. CC208A TaxID=3044573 RepID=UPI0024A7C1E8|nr:hypothetical protein [Streptomyces sp. CC208A]
MIIVYSPRGGEVQRFDARLRVSETVRAAQTVDRSWPDIRSSLDVDRESMRVVAWVVQKRDQPDLRYGDFDPFEDELAVKLDRDEVRRYAEALAGAAWLEKDATTASVTARLRGVPLIADDREHAEQLVTSLAVARPKDHPSPGEPTTGPSETPEP